MNWVVMTGCLDGAPSTRFVRTWAHSEVRITTQFVRYWAALCDKRYLLSLDDPEARLVRGTVGTLTDSPPFSGSIYARAGALTAGMTNARRQPTRWIDPQSGELRSVYAGGRNLLPELRERGVRLIREGAKRRYVFVLAPEGSPLYASYRAALPHSPVGPARGPG